MKTTILKTLTIFLLFMIASIGRCFAESKEVILVKVPVILVDENPIGDRMPSRPIQCMINEDGIFIQGYDANDILSYEVYDLDGTCLLMTDDANEFVAQVLYSSEAVDIKLCTKDYMLCGYL